MTKYGNKTRSLFLLHRRHLRDSALKRMASSLAYLMIQFAVLVLVTLRSHVLLPILGPGVVAIGVVGAVGVQRRLQVGQQGIYNQNENERDDSGCMTMKT